MNSGKNFYDKHTNKDTKKKQKSKEQSENNNENSQRIVNGEENNFLNKKKNRDKNEINEEKDISQNDKLEINQNMYNQYNFYQGFVPSIEWQLEQLRNQNINYQEYIQNIYYIQNQYTVFQNDNELQPYLGGEKVFTNLKAHINNIYERGIVNNIIGAFFIEECKEMKNVDENSINNEFDLKKDKKDDKSCNLKDVKKTEKNQKNCEKTNDIKNNNENINNQVIDNEEESNDNEYKLRKPILIW